MPDRRVVVTGVGAASALGDDAPTTWRGLVDGETGAAPITRFDAEGRVGVACEVDGAFDDHPAVDARNAGRYARMAVVAAAEALDDAAFDPDGPEWDGDRVGTSVASSLGGVPEFETGVAAVDRGERIATRFMVRYLPNLAAGHVSMAVGARGPTHAPATACAAGADAVADAADELRLGRADAVVVAGTETPVTPTVTAGFDAMRALSTRTDADACRPFDADRDGFVLGEGAGALVLETERHAAARGADALAELRGYGRTADAAHPTRPRDDASGLARAIERALADGRLDPAGVGGVNAHATGTPAGDAHEARALRAVFDDVPPVTAPKGALGHTLGAAGALEAVVAVRSVETGVLPPTPTYETPDADADVPVATDATEVDGAVLSNSAGFGGVNAALVFAEVPR